MIAQPTEKMISHSRAENRNNSAGVQHKLHAVLDGNFTLLNITIIIPCYNEAAAIATVVADFQKSLPNASNYVYNNSFGNDAVTRTLAASASKPGACASWIYAMLSILACNNDDKG